MATFPITNPVYGTKINSSPKVNVLSFGDGFEQRLTEGLNQNPLSLNLTFELSQTQANTAIAFLNARVEDGASFDFTVPSEQSSRKFVCTSFPRSIPYLNRVTLTCTFREVFEA